MKLKAPARRLRAVRGTGDHATRVRRWARRAGPSQHPFPRRSRSSAAAAAEWALDGVEGAEAEETEALGIGSRIVPRDLGFEEVPSSPPPISLGGVDVEAQLHALEARLDGLIRGATEARDALEPAGPKARGAESRGAGSPGAEVGSGRGEPNGGNLVIARAAALSSPPRSVDATRQVFQSPYFVKQWGRIALRSRSEEVDDFGLDPRLEERLRPLFDFLFRRYFRVTTLGIGNVPSEGATVVVANHSGTLPLDGAMLRTAFRLKHPAARDLRWLAEDFIFYLPFAGAFMNRVGAVRACPENAERLLASQGLIAVFPEGEKGIRKLYRERYRLQRFGRGGFVRLCLRTGAPLIPCAIVGAEETAPMLYRVEYLSELVGLPYIPVTPTFPWLGPFGLLPAPTKWTLHFGEPIELSHYGPEAADDHVLVGRLAEQVRSTIQELIERGVGRRKSVWFG